MTSALFIDGEWCTAADGRAQEVLSPATLEPVGVAAVGGVADAQRAVQAARAAFDDGRWSELAPAARAEALTRFADSIRRGTERHVALMVAEAGAPLASARGSVQSALRHLEFAIDVLNKGVDRALAPPWRPAGRRAHSGSSMVRRIPVGVVSTLTPFNAPLLQTVPKVGAALAMGNTVVVKPSPYTPLEVLVLGEAALEAGLPAGVLNIVTGGADVGQALGSDPAVDMVSFTGSDSVGAQVFAQAAPGLKRLVLELGGKSAMIVRPDADLDLAGGLGAANMTTLSGQGCALLTRHIVHRSLLADYLKTLQRQLDDVVVGNPAHPDTTMGPLINAHQRERVTRLVDEARARGAHIECGGRPTAVDGAGWFFEPTLVTGIDNSDPLAQFEVFGPVAVVLPFDEDEEAVAIANDSRYGLNGAVLSADVGQALAMAQRIRAGRVTVNETAFDIRLPFGGIRRSGVGREFGVEGVLEYTETQALQW
jgi:aldehyde dehydrogenase (NAD+)